MPPFTIAFLDRSVAVEAPDSLAGDVAAFFRLVAAEPATKAATRRAVISEESAGRYSLELEDEAGSTNLTRGEVLYRLATLIGRNTFIDGPGIALNAAAVGWGEKAILIVGQPAGGKSSLVAWFIEKGFAYVADDNVVLSTSPGMISGFAEPPALRPDPLVHIAGLPTFHDAPSVRAVERLLIAPAPTWGAPDATAACGMVIHCRFEAGAALRIEPMAPADATLRLLENTRKVVIPSDAEYAPVAALGAAAPAIRLTYGGYGQIDGVLDFLARTVFEADVDSESLARFLTGFVTPAPAVAPTTFPVQPATTRRFSPKLTIGMATYDDYDGVYFSIQAIRMYHPEILDQVEFLVIDNHPDGICGKPLKELENGISNYRYLPLVGEVGTAASRELIFSEGDGEFALCMDCHVFIVPGALRRLLAYFDADPLTRDLLQGPMVADDLASLSTHFDPVWRMGMYGIWGNDPAADDPDAPPFDIPMQGLGLFACRRAAWPGFNPLFAGFGGEEGYIHEKFRRAGGRTLCLPFLRWMHRFQRPLGPPYRNTWEDRYRNYLIGHRELGWPTADLEAHFAERLGEAPAARMLATILQELDRA